LPAADRQHRVANIEPVEHEKNSSSLTIREFSREPLAADDLVRLGTLAGACSTF